MDSRFFPFLFRDDEFIEEIKRQRMNKNYNVQNHQPITNNNNQSIDNSQTLQGQNFTGHPTIYGNMYQAPALPQTASKMPINPYYYQPQMDPPFPQQMNYIPNALLNATSFREDTKLEDFWGPQIQQQIMKSQPSHSNVPEIFCGKCFNPILPNQQSIQDINHVFHLNCFKCDLCKQSINGYYSYSSGKIICSAHNNQSFQAPPPSISAPPPSELPSTHPAPASSSSVVSSSLPPTTSFELQPGNMGSIAAQPAVYQIANYNVHPPPKLTLSKPIETDQDVSVHLVEVTSGYELSEGFQAGTLRSFKKGGNSLQFTGLKLNKMGKIKNELRQHHVLKCEQFLVRFRLAAKTWDSVAFKLVSSCTQLPSDLKYAVRPSKRPHAGSSRDQSSPNPQHGWGGSLQSSNSFEEYDS